MTATGALIARHVTDLFPTQTSRFDLAQAARRGVIAPLRCIRIPPGPGRADDRQGAAAQGRGRPGLRPGELAELLDQAPFNVAIADLYKTRFNGVPGVVYTAGVQARQQRRRGVPRRRASRPRPSPARRRSASWPRSSPRYERGEVDVLVQRAAARRGLELAARDDLHAPRADRLAAHLPAARRPRDPPPPGQGGGPRHRLRPPGDHATTSPIVTLHSLLDRDVYRGGAIVVGPVRRGRGRRVRVERRVVPVSADRGAPASRSSSASSGGSPSSTSTTASSTSGRRSPARACSPAAGAAPRRCSSTTAPRSSSAASCSPASQRNRNSQLRLQRAAARSPRCATPRPSTTRSTSSAPGRATSAARARRSCCRRSPRSGSAAATRRRPGSGASPSTPARCTRSTRCSAGRRPSACSACSSTPPAAPTAATPAGSSTPRASRTAACRPRCSPPRVAHTPEAEEVLRGARMRMARKPGALARELLRNFPKGKGRRGRRRKKQAAPGENGAVDGAAARRARPRADGRAVEAPSDRRRDGGRQRRAQARPPRDGERRAAQAARRRAESRRRRPAGRAPTPSPGVEAAASAEQAALAASRCTSPASSAVRPPPSSSTTSRPSPSMPAATPVAAGPARSRRPAQRVALAVGARAAPRRRARARRSSSPQQPVAHGRRCPRAARPSVAAVSRAAPAGRSATSQRDVEADAEHGPALLRAPLDQDARDLAVVEQHVVGPLDPRAVAARLAPRRRPRRAAAGRGGSRRTSAHEQRAARRAPTSVRPWRPRPAVCSAAVTSVPCGAPACGERAGAVVRRVGRAQVQVRRPERALTPPAGCGPRRRGPSPSSSAAEPRFTASASVR